MATLVIYKKGISNVMGGEAAGDAGQSDYLSDDVRATLHTSTYVPDATITGHELKADATNEVAPGNGYSTGGVALNTKTIAASGSNWVYSCAAFSWTASGGSIVFRYCVIWNSTPTTPADPLIGYIDAGAQTITDGNTVTFTPGANGLWTVTGT